MLSNLLTTTYPDDISLSPLKAALYLLNMRDFSPLSKIGRISILTCSPLLKELLVKLNVRLACVKHFDSVQSEPSPNSPMSLMAKSITINFWFYLFLDKVSDKSKLFLEKLCLSKLKVYVGFVKLAFKLYILIKLSLNLFHFLLYT